MIVLVLVILVATVAYTWGWWRLLGADDNGAPSGRDPVADARYQHFLDHGPEEERIP